MDIFTRPLEEYQREINPFTEYKAQSAFYLSKVKNIPKEVALAKLEESIKAKAINFQDPTVVCYERGENGDTAKTNISLFNYIKETVQNKYVLVPTFTNYVSEEVNKSPLVDFVDMNVKNRSKAKKEGFKAKNEGDMVKFTFKHNEQNNLKTYNNSLSGTFATEGSIFNNPTAHSTLTSVTRMETSLANSLNEKIIAGNRHYRNLKITLNNINFLAYIADREKIKAVITKYNLKYPTVDDVFKCIDESTMLYWVDGNASYKIRTYLEKLDEIELASIMYTSDLYHIRQLNPVFMRELFTRLITKVTDKEFDNPVELMEKVPEAVGILAHQICMTEVVGIGKDYFKLSKDKVNTLVATCHNIMETLDHYKDFFQTFFVTSDVPVSVANIKAMVRKAVVLSDTDSTMFSSDEWVMWYNNGELIFNDQGYAIAGVIGFISSQAIVHVLANYSVNMGVARDKLFRIQMKPEYVFPVFVQSPVAKHYFTCIIMQEGSVYPTPDWETKGVHFLSSAKLPEIMLQTRTKMREILSTIMNNKKISLVDELKELLALEREYKADILENRKYYFNRTTIKEAASYKDVENRCPYWHYKLWNYVFEPTYGPVSPPPYKAFVIPLSINNKTDMLNWIASIENKELGQRLVDFLEATGKGVVRTINLSEDYIRAFGIPKELLSIIDIKRVILSLTLARRMIIDSLGFTPKTDMLFMEYVD